MEEHVNILNIARVLTPFLPPLSGEFLKLRPHHKASLLWCFAGDCLGGVLVPLYRLASSFFIIIAVSRLTLVSHQLCGSCVAVCGRFFFS